MTELHWLWQQLVRWLLTPAVPETGFFGAPDMAGKHGELVLLEPRAFLQLFKASKWKVKSRKKGTKKGIESRKHPLKAQCEHKMTKIGCLKLVMKIITTLFYFSATVWTKDCKARVWTSAAWRGWELSQEMRREENYLPSPAPEPGCVFTRGTLLLLSAASDPPPGSSTQILRACTTFKGNLVTFNRG